MEALKRQGARTDLTSSQVGTKLRADEQIALDAGTSRNQIQRYVRLTELKPELQKMVDENKMGMARSIASDFYITQTPYFLLLHVGDMHPQLFIETENSAEVDILRYGACSA